MLARSLPDLPAQAAAMIQPNEVLLDAFAAFRRPQNAAEKRLAADQDALQTLASAQAESQVNPSLARAVYSAQYGRLFLIPGAGRICLLAIGMTSARALHARTTLKRSVRAWASSITQPTTRAKTAKRSSQARSPMELRT